jgi:hypothetical protein
MARLTIQFLPRDSERQLAVRVALDSDEDATPREHEQQHRRLVVGLFPGLNLDGDAGSHVEIEREAPQSEPALGCSCGDGGYEVIDLG